MTRVVLLLLTLLASCVATVPYEPARQRLPLSLPDDAFIRVRDAVAIEYPSLVEADPDEFVVRTDWCPRDHRGVATKARATLWLEDDDLCAVVEVRYLRGTLLGNPEWTSAMSQPFWERDLLERANSALRVTSQ